MPPPPDSAFRFRPLAVLRSALAVIVGYLVYALILQGAVMLAWGDMIEAPSAILVPIAVVLLLFSLVAGGAVAGRLAGRAPGGHGLLVGFLALVITVVGIFVAQSLEPWWFRVVGAVVSLPMAYLGAELAGYKAPIMPPEPPPGAYMD
jgi:hypothetical protein